MRCSWSRAAAETDGELAASQMQSAEGGLLVVGYMGEYSVEDENCACSGVSTCIKRRRSSAEKHRYHYVLAIVLRTLE